MNIVSIEAFCLTASLEWNNADFELCTGARVGGLGNMPGWWFTIESTTSRHFIQQFKTALENALRSKPEVRAIMRARATKQRFPVSQWVEDLEKLQSSAIEISHKQAAKEKRPTFDSPNTPTILETPSMLNILRPRVPPSKRPRSAVVPPTIQSRGLSTISEARPHSGISQASDPGRLVTSFSEGRLLSRSSPGLGSKMGPSSRRKPPPSLVLNHSATQFTKMDVTAVRSDGDEPQKDNSRRLPIPRSPSSPNMRTKPVLGERDASERPTRPEPRRSQTMPQLHPNDKKAVRLLGMQLSSSRASELTSPKHSPKHGDESSHQQPSSPGTPVTPHDGYYTPPTTPTPPPSRVSRQRVSFTTSTAPTSASEDTFVSGENSESTATSVSDGNSSGAANPVNAAKIITIHTPHAVDAFPSLGPHYFPHGGIPVLSASNVKGEKPDNVLQNITPFFSDPDKKYENKFIGKMKNLNGKNSENDLCIEEFLLESEKSWFTQLRAAQLRSNLKARALDEQKEAREEMAREDEFGLGNNHKPPTGLKRVLRMKIGDWPIYSFLLAFVRKPRPSLERNSSAYVELSLGPNHSRQLVPNHTSRWDCW